MKINVVFAVFLGLAYCSCTQPTVQTGQPSKELLPYRTDRAVIEYDRFEDSTTIHSASSKVSDGLVLVFSYQCAGHSTECEPGYIAASFFITAGPSRNSYANSPELIFLADGLRINPAPFAKRPLWTADANGDGVLVTAFKPDDFLKLVRSHLVEGRLGPTEFTVQESALKHWRTFATGIRSKTAGGRKP